MSSNSEIVRDFVAACNANDLERMLAFFDPECVYHNIPLEPVAGIDLLILGYFRIQIGNTDVPEQAIGKLPMAFQFRA